ncbi:MAG: hypothetical protein AAF747_09915, partial [Planctomycetota bacterium]
MGMKLRGAIEVVIAFALTGAIVAVLLLAADRIPLRLDVTAAGEQQLSPQTTALLDALPAIGPDDIRIVVAGEQGAIDRDIRREVRDVLDLFDAHPAVLVEYID